MKRSILSIVLALGMACITIQARSALPTNTTLSIDIVSSYFAFDANGNGTVEDSEKTPIAQNNGLIIGAIQPASGSHPGAPDGSESPDIDIPWLFFGNTGMHQSSSAVTVITDNGTTQDLDFSGWGVTWNGIPSIPLSGDPTNFPSDSGIATVDCSIGGCTNNDPYLLDYSAHVPLGDPSGFGGVFYTLHLEGLISLPNAIPVAYDDVATTIIGNPITVDVTANDDSTEPLIPGSVAIDTQSTDGTATDNPDDTITYTPNTGPDFSGIDSFVYTVDNTIGSSLAFPAGIAGQQGLVYIDIQTNVAPVTNSDLNNDSLSTSTAALDGAGGSIVVDILANDTDANNSLGLPGGIDPTSVTVLGQPATGTCTANPDGTITYSQPLPSVTETDTCTYLVSDIDAYGPPLASNTGTIDINISGNLSDWNANLDPDIIPILQFDPGIPDPSGDTTLLPQSGTYFSVLVSPITNTSVFTPMTPGSDGGMIIGHDQIAGNSHTGFPTGNEVAVLDRGWNFFGNTGMTFTKSGGIVGNPDGTLKFNGDPAINNGQGKFNITWNGIPAIDLGGSDAFPEDKGFATINCDSTIPVNQNNMALCADEDFFELDYAAHVPPGDPSGFGGIQYNLSMTGTVRFLDGAPQTSNGSFSVANRLPQASTPPDSDMLIQCVGDCFGFTVTDVTHPSISMVMPLAGGIPNSNVDGLGNTAQPELRVLRDNAWGSFITNAADPASNDTVKSAAMVAGGTFGQQCPPPGDASFGALTSGHQCIEVTIEDNGLNDQDPGLGTITDLSGIGLPAVGGPADSDMDGILDLNDNCPLTPNPEQQDLDGDGVGDVCDNCINVPNGPLYPDASGNSQLDSDGDGYGNMCDGDLNQSGFVDFADLTLFSSVFFTADLDADLDGSSFVQFADLSIFSGLFFQPPGPSCCAP